MGTCAVLGELKGSELENEDNKEWLCLVSVKYLFSNQLRPDEVFFCVFMRI